MNQRFTNSVGCWLG